MSIDKEVVEAKRLQDKFLNLRASGLIEESLNVEREYLTKRISLLSERSVSQEFKPLTLNEIKAEPTEIVCKDFIPLIKGAYNLLAGAGGVGKSTVAIRSAMHYLRANPNKRAFLAMGEDDSIEVKTRVESIGKVFLHLSDEDIMQMIERMDFVTVDNPLAMRFLETSVDGARINIKLVSSFENYLKVNQIDFVVLDPLKKFHSVNENSNSEMDLLVRDVFLEMAGRLKIVMLVLHHSAKDISTMGSRGASTISDTARVAYKLSKFYVKDPKSGELIENKEEGDNIRISVIKDNKNIFKKYGYRNTDNGKISLYALPPRKFDVEINTYGEVPTI